MPARVSFATAERIIVTVPNELEGGASAIRVRDVAGSTFDVRFMRRCQAVAGLGPMNPAAGAR